MRKRNDYLQKLMADNFTGDNLRKSHAVTGRAELTPLVSDHVRVDVKQKEMQTKLYQDLQVQAKMEAKKREEQEKQAEHLALLAASTKFKEDEAKKKQEIKERNKKHANLVIKQMKEEPRSFAKTGIAILTK